MKNIILSVLLVLIPALICAETFLTEEFDTGIFPPEGWSIDDHSSNWNANNTNNAGGEIPEARFSWSPQFNNTSRLISNTVDLTGLDNISLEFKHNVDHYHLGYTLGVATRIGAGEWNSIWEINPVASVPAETVILILEDYEYSDFQICWYFFGDSYNINYWYIDDIYLYSNLEHDVAVTEIILDPQYEPGTEIIPRAYIENNGLNTETFDVTCDILANENLLYSNTHSPITIEPNQEQLISFDPYILENENELYKVEIYTNLTTDMDNSNDLLSKYINTYTNERNMVIMETATGTWSGYCPGAAMGADDLVNNGHDVAVVQYHSGDDYENPASSSRINYYSIASYPTAIFDGIERNTEGSHNQSLYSSYLPIYNQRKAINTAFQIEILSDSTYYPYFNIDVLLQKTAPISYENLVLHVVLTQSNIMTDWQGQDHLNFVEYQMLPDENGTFINFSDTDSLSVPFNFYFFETTEDFELVAFIQDAETKEILQGTKVPVTDLETSINEITTSNIKTRLLGNYPNPFIIGGFEQIGTSISYQLDDKCNENSSIKIFNIKGQLVKEFKELPLNNNTGSVCWNGKDKNNRPVSTGIYLYRLNNKDFSMTKKMLIIKN